jgi:hypothetical protein
MINGNSDPYTFILKGLAFGWRLFRLIKMDFILVFYVGYFIQILFDLIDLNRTRDTWSE